MITKKVKKLRHQLKRLNNLSANTSRDSIEWPFLRVVNLLPTGVIPRQGGTLDHCTPLEKLEGRSHPRNVTDARVSIPRRSWDRRSLCSPILCEERVRSPRKFQGPETSETMDTLSRSFPIHETGREETWKQRKQLSVTILISLLYFYIIPIYSRFIFINSSHIFLLPYIPQLHYPRYYKIYIYIYKITPASLRNIHPFHPLAEHRNSVEKILGRWERVREKKWRGNRNVETNDLGPTIEEGGEVDTARCAAVSRWRRRRRERRLAGFRGCTVGTSPSPCIPIDR